MPSSEMELSDILAAKCGRIASAVELRGVEAETMETVVRFCEGREARLTAENAVAVACLAHALDMSESRCRDNLLRRCIGFINHRVLPAWNDTVRALRSSEPVRRHAAAIGLLPALLDSLVSKALADPRLLLLQTPSPPPPSASSLSARRSLFSTMEDIAVLPLTLYEPLAAEMLRQGVPPRHVAASLRRYARKWAFRRGSDASDSRREIVEAVQRLLPEEDEDEDRGFLFEMLACANASEASSECREWLEARVGRLLNEATVEELSSVVVAGGACDVVVCLKRLLKHCPLDGERVAQLLEEFLEELAGEAGMDRKLFAEVAGVAAEICSRSGRCSDGVYRAVDVFLGLHRDLSESEREEACRVLDFERMSPEACDHAARNQKLPMRAVVQVLFSAQLHLRDSIVAAQSSHAEEEEYEYEEEEDKRLLLLPRYGHDDDDEIRAMSEKLGELERECVAMKREMVVAVQKKKEKKVSLWKEMKRKFGCVASSVSDCNNCQVSNKKRKMKMRH